MSIELHCPQCGKLIRAPKDSGGKKGKCPYCKRTVYIPTQVSEEDVIPLAPLDPAEEARIAELRRESAKYAAAVDHAKDAVGAIGKGTPGGAAGSPGKVMDVGSVVLSYIRAMRDAELGEAEATVEKLRRVGTRAKDHVQGLLLDEMPPEVENVPPPVLKGFLKTLLERLQ